MAGPRLVSVPEGALEVEVRGAGEPVVLIQTALVADELRPLAEQLLRGGDVQVIRYHRRGYGRSTPARGAGSITGDALDCHQLLVALGIDRAHVVGVSYGAAVALQLASSVPDCVHSLCVIEPPPVDVPCAPEFLAANAELQADYRRYGSAIALERFMVRIAGHRWRHDIEQHLPGAVAQVERDAATFFVTDVPALLALAVRGSGRSPHHPARPLRGRHRERTVVRGDAPARPGLAAPGRRPGGAGRGPLPRAHPCRGDRTGGDVVPAPAPISA